MGKVLENSMSNLFPVSNLNYLSPFSGKLGKRQRLHFKQLFTDNLNKAKESFETKTLLGHIFT